MRLGAECKHCNKKPEKFVNNYHADIHSLTALRLKIKVLRVGILGEDARMGRIGGTPQFRNLRAISPQLRALHPRLRRISL